ILFVFLYFFFKAEDGIRDRNVTGVQTCALPISCACACLGKGKLVSKRLYSSAVSKFLNSISISCIMISYSIDDIDYDESMENMQRLSISCSYGKIRSRLIANLKYDRK